VLKGVQKELGKVTKDFPQVKLTQIYTSVDSTYEMFESSMLALIEGSILAVLVVWFFLRDSGRQRSRHSPFRSRRYRPSPSCSGWGSRSIRSASLRFRSWRASSWTIAIVEIENIVRHMRMGKSGFQAALDAADEIGLAVVACSATIIAVSCRSFMGGITDSFFEQFRAHRRAAVFFSLLVARLITPVIAAYSLKSTA